MSNKTRIDKLLEFYRSSGEKEMSEELIEYQDRLDYCRDLLKRHDAPIVWKLMVKKFGRPGYYSRATAYNDIRDTKRFFASDFDSSDRPFERVMAIERLKKMYEMAYDAAKSTKDFYYCSKIEQQINELKGLFVKDEEFDPRAMRPSLVQLVLPTNGRPKSLDVSKIDEIPASTIELIENVGYTVENMERDLNKLSANDN